MCASVAYGLIELGWLNGVLLVSMFASACSTPFVCLCHSEFAQFTLSVHEHKLGMTVHCPLFMMCACVTCTQERIMNTEQRGKSRKRPRQ